MRHVAERPVVAALIDVHAMSQYIPSSAVSSAIADAAVGIAAQPGRPDRR